MTRRGKYNAPMLLLPGNALGIMSMGMRLDPAYYGWLLSPARTMTREGLYGLSYAVDNEVFTQRFEPGRFRRALIRIRDAHGPDACRFVVAPDVLYDAAATLRQFGDWSEEIRGMGLPVALAAQDGLKYDPSQDHFYVGSDLDVTDYMDVCYPDVQPEDDPQYYDAREEWRVIVETDEMDALFVGGSTGWKLSDDAARLMHAARARGKWVHAGRVNSWYRYAQFKCKPDSIDGTHWTKKPNRYLREWETERRLRCEHPTMKFMSSVEKWSP